jgi:hypothetical protein
LAQAPSRVALPARRGRPAWSRADAARFGGPADRQLAPLGALQGLCPQVYNRRASNSAMRRPMAAASAAPLHRSTHLERSAPANRAGAGQIGKGRRQRPGSGRALERCGRPGVGGVGSQGAGTIGCEHLRTSAPRTVCYHETFIIFCADGLHGGAVQPSQGTAQTYMGKVGRPDKPAMTPTLYSMIW